MSSQHSESHTHVTHHTSVVIQSYTLQEAINKLITQWISIHLISYQRGTKVMISRMKSPKSGAHRSFQNFPFKTVYHEFAVWSQLQEQQKISAWLYGLDCTSRYMDLGSNPLTKQNPQQWPLPKGFPYKGGVQQYMFYENSTDYTTHFFQTAEL